jgi:hypothetical protein
MSGLACAANVAQDEGELMSEATITKTEWRITGDHVGSCNCIWACPCQFNGLPTHGNCEALLACHIREGHFGETSLDGVRFAEAFWWPGAVHEGGGTRLLVLDEGTNPDQRAAVTGITSGEQGHPYFEIFASVAPNNPDTVIAPIEIETDRETRHARVDIPGLGGTTVEPIRNPITGDEHRVRIDLPNGFEYKQAEIANAVRWEVNAADPLSLLNENSYTQMFAFDWSSDGGTR